MRKVLAVIIALTALPAFSAQVFVEKNLDSFFKPAPPSTANATCFMYKNNHFKCACRFSDNSKIWVSKPLEQFNGELGTMNDKYGNIEACRK